MAQVRISCLEVSPAMPKDQAPAHEAYPELLT